MKKSTPLSNSVLCVILLVLLRLAFAYTTGEYTLFFEEIGVRALFAMFVFMIVLLGLDDIYGDKQ